MDIHGRSTLHALVAGATRKALYIRKVFRLPGQFASLSTAASCLVRTESSSANLRVCCCTGRARLSAVPHALQKFVIPSESFCVVEEPAVCRRKADS